MAIVIYILDHLRPASQIYQLRHIFIKFHQINTIYYSFNSNVDMPQLTKVD